MPIFMHVSTKTTKLKIKKIHKPILHLKGDFYRIDFILSKSLFMSELMPNGSSDWLEWRKNLCENKLKQLSNEEDDNCSVKCYNEIENRRDDQEHYLNDDSWLSSDKKYYFDINFDKHKIFIVDNANDFIRLFIDYGYYKFNIKYVSNVDQSKDKLALKNLINYNTINNFYNNLEEDIKVSLLSEKINQLVESRNKRNMSLLKTYKNKIIIPDKGFTNIFLADLIRTKNYYDNLVGDVNELHNKIRIGISTFNFYKMNSDGYKGIYYTKNVIKRNTTECFINNKCSRYCQRAINFDIGDFPEDIRAPIIFQKMGLSITEDFKKDIKEEISWLTGWLGSEQMMLWDWKEIPTH